MSKSAKFLICAAVSLALAFAYSPDLWAKRFGGSFKFSSAKSYKKPSWGGSRSRPASGSATRSAKPSRSAERPAARPASSQASARRAAAPSAEARQRRLAKTPTNHFSSAKQKSAYQRYQNRQQSKFKGKAGSVGANAAQTTSSPIYKRAANNIGARSGSYWDRRDRFYGGWSAPGYIYRGAPSYGMWDGLFLGFLLSNASSRSYASVAHHHQKDPGLQEWMAKMEALAVENAEVRQQLGALKTEMAKMSGVPIDPSYLPEGVDPDLVLAPAVVANLKPSFRLCTADRNGNYHRFGEFVRNAATNSINVEILNTAGSMENLEYLENDRCDGAYVQRNAFTAYADRNPAGSYDFERIASPTLEYAHMVCNRASGVDDVGDLIGKTLLIGEAGSGTEVTWADFVGMDDHYAKVNTRNLGGLKGLNEVVMGEADCLLYVASLNTGIMKRANELGDQLVMVPVNDWDFNDRQYGGGKLFKGHLDQSGEPVYVFRDLPSGQYSNIQDGLFSSAVETLSVPVDMVASLSWSERNGPAYEALVGAVLESQSSISDATHAR